MPVVPTTFQSDMERHLIEFKERVQYLPATNEKKKWQYHDLADNLFPPIRHGSLQYAYDTAMPLHDYFNHVRSSQAFAVNLLYPQLREEPGVILDCLGRRSAAGRQGCIGISTLCQ